MKNEKVSENPKPIKKKTYSLKCLRNKIKFLFPFSAKEENEVKI